MAIELITGRAGTPHVDSADVGALNAALFGAGAYVLEGIDAELVDANNVRVSAGEMLCEGRHIRITGDGEALTIDNGTSAYKRNDIIAAHYLRDEDGMESVTLAVIKGAPTVDSPIDPAMPTAGKLIEGASEVYWPLYRVTINGLTPQTPAFIAKKGRTSAIDIPQYELNPSIEVAEGSDLNNYKTEGTYWLAMKSTVANAPISNGTLATLLVERVNNSYIRQTISTIRPVNDNGGYTFVRRLDGNSGTWSDWVSTSGIDSIVAEGTTNGWTWIKYANGICHLTYIGHVKVLDVGASSAAAGHYYMSIAPASPYPFSLVDKIAYKNAMIVDSSETNLFAGDRFGNANGFGNSFFIRFSNIATTEKRYLAVDVWGRWK